MSNGACAGPRHCRHIAKKEGETGHTTHGNNGFSLSAQVAHVRLYTHILCRSLHTRILSHWSDHILPPNNRLATRCGLRHRAITLSLSSLTNKVLVSPLEVQRQISAENSMLEEARKLLVLALRQMLQDVVACASWHEVK